MGRHDDRDARARARLDEMVRGSRAPGIQYVVVDAAGPVFEHAAGWADLAGRVPMTSRTTLMAYSMSKTITACATLRLVAMGRLGLDDPLERHAATLYRPGITIRHLLAHLSGIPNPIPLRWVHSAARHPTFDERAALITEIAAHPHLEFAPGSRFRYSNIGYWLLGAVIERASGEPFTAFVARHVLAPLQIGADEMGYAIPKAAPHASGYLERYSLLDLIKRFVIDREFIGPVEGRWVKIEPHYLDGPAFGGVVGAATGFGKFLQDQLRAPLGLLGDVGRQMFERQRTNSGALVPMTLGWHVGGSADAPMYFKQGGGGGFHCEMRVYPAGGVASVMMTNATAFDVKRALSALDPEFAVRDA